MGPEITLRSEQKSVPSTAGVFAPGRGCRAVALPLVLAAAVAAGCGGAGDADEGTGVDVGGTVTAESTSSRAVEPARAAAPAPQAASSRSGGADAVLRIGGEGFDFEITHCRTDTYVTGNLTVFAELTAVGSVRGQPAVLLVSKSEGGGTLFEQSDLYLTEVAESDRSLAPLALVASWDERMQEYGRRRNAEIAAEFDQEKIGQLPPEEAMAAMEEFGRQHERLNEEFDAMQNPQGRSFGEVEVDGSTIEFVGEDLRLIHGEVGNPWPQLTGDVVVRAKCGA